MDEAALQEKFSNIKQRQYLILVLLIIPYFFGTAELFGYAAAGFLFAVVGTIAFVVVAVQRRRIRDMG